MTHLLPKSKAAFKGLRVVGKGSWKKREVGIFQVEKFALKLGSDR